MKIVVIGGGYTGLVAALRLAEAGHNVTILEKGEHFGGLAADFKIEGAHLEKAYHHIFKTDTSIIDMANELGVGEKLKWHDSSLATYYGGKLYPFMTAIDLLRFTPLSLINRVRAGLVVLYLQRTKNWHKFENVSAYDWMLKAAGKQVTEVIWEPLLRGKFEKYYNKVSMAWLWARVHVRSNSREPGDAGEKLGYFNGGFQIFTDALIRALKKHNVQLRTGVQIASLTNKNNQVRVNFADGSNEIYDKCLATIPTGVFAKLITNNDLPNKYLKQLSATKYLGALLYIFSSSQEISKYYWHNISDTKLPFLVFINHTRLIDKKIFKNKYVYYVGAYLPMDNALFNASEEEIKRVWHKGLQQVFPDFDATKIHEDYIFKLGHAQHIVGADYRKEMPEHKTPLPNIYLANFAQVYPEDRGTNYAVRDGEKVAKLMLKG